MIDETLGKSATSGTDDLTQTTGTPPATPPTEAPIETPKLTQEEVNALVVERLKKQKDGFLKKYGVDDEMKLDELVGKAKLHDEMKVQLDTLKSSNASLTEKLAFIENNINPERYEDIRIYFKGKGLEFTPDNFVKEIATHKEWLNTKAPANIQVGASKPTPKPINEKEEALKMFNL